MNAWSWPGLLLFPSFMWMIYMRTRRFSSLQHVWSVTQDGCCSLLCPNHQSLMSLPLINRKKVPILQPDNFVHDIIFLKNYYNLLSSAVYNTEQFHFYSIDWLVSPLNTGMIQPAFNCPFNWVFEFLTIEHILFSNCQKRERRKGKARRG